MSTWAIARARAAGLTGPRPPRRTAATPPGCPSGRDPAIREPDPGPGDQVPHGGRDQHLVRRRRGGDPRSDVHRDAAHLVAEDLALPGVDPGADGDAELAHGRGDGRGA